MSAYHQHVPRDPAANVRFRLAVLEQCAADADFARGIREICRRDVFFYINVFVWQTNPRKKGAEDGPFITWDFQEAAIRVILEQIDADETLVIEKSREMGATWICLITQDWLCRFWRRKNFIDMSHTEDAVDKADDPNSLFAKLEFIQENLPGFLHTAQKKKLVFRYPDTRSIITGTSTTDRAGVGGRATGMFLDEFAKQKDDFAILGNTRDTSGARIFNSTHYGIETAFNSLCQRPDIRKLVMHWSEHPEKRRGLYRFNPETQKADVLDPSLEGKKVKVGSKEYVFPLEYPFVTDGMPSGGPHPGLRSPWYDNECIQRNDARQVALHLDIDPMGAKTQFFDPIVVNNLRIRWGRRPEWQGYLHYERDTARPVGLVKGEGGPIKLWLTPTRDDRAPTGRYAAGADIAGGTGNTPSCMTVIVVETGEKVLEFADAHIKIHEFAPLAVAICRLFADSYGSGAMFAWEAAGPGIAFGQMVVDEFGYTNVHYRRDEVGTEKRQSDKPGWYPTPTNKRMLLEAYKHALQCGDFMNPSDKALEECLSFAYADSNKIVHGHEKSDDPSSARENHGDRVIADALAWHMAREQKAARPKSEVNDIPWGSFGWRQQQRRRERLLAMEGAA